MNSTAESKTDIFISYSRAQSAQVEALANYLSEVGFSVFWDPQIDDFSKFKDYLTKKIEETNVFLVCWSKEAIASEWVNWEAEFAGTLNKKIVGITLDGDRPQGNFAESQIRSLRNWDSLIRPRQAQELAYSIADKLSHHSRENLNKIKSLIDDHATVRSLSKLWFVLSGFTCYYALSNWISTQNGGSPLGLVVDTRTIQGSLISLVSVGILSLICFRVLNKIPAYNKHENWHNRLPRASISAIDPRSPASKPAIIIKLTLALFPIASLIHFLNRTRTGQVTVCDSADPTILISAWALPKGFSELVGHNYCFGSDPIDSASQGVTFIPFVEPALITALLAWLTFEIFKFIRNTAK